MPHDALSKPSALSVPKIPVRTTAGKEERLPEVGEWWWLTVKADEDSVDEGKPTEELVCVMETGSNYLAYRQANSGRYGRNTRMLYSDFLDNARRAPDAEAYLQGVIEHWDREAMKALFEIKELAKRLGLQENPKLTAETTALAVVSSQKDVKEYQQALSKARDKTIPELQDKIKQCREQMARWMETQSLPLEAQAAAIKTVLSGVKDRIFRVSLYAGINEDAVKVRDGNPAAVDEKLHVMRHRRYMDEECLAGYRTGGISIESIDEFDRWLLQPEHFDRLFPYPRCLAVFRVRGIPLQREAHDLFSAMVAIRLAEQDKLTFLYVRNGDQLFRVNTEIDFSEDLFPAGGALDYSKMTWLRLTRKFAGEKELSLATEEEYQDWVQTCREARKEIAEAKRLSKEWKKQNPKKHEFDNPHRRAAEGREWDRYLHEAVYEPFNRESVWYDDAVKLMQSEIDYYNRVMLVLQGLFDRSMMLHPHRNPQLWETFDDHIQLVGDEVALEDGGPPDWEAYVAQVNASLGEGSVTIGQEDVWMRREAKAEAERNREFDIDRRPTFRPWGDPGPGFLARVEKWSKGKKVATYRWKRPRRRSAWAGRNDLVVDDRIDVSMDKLFNVSGYKPGDYLMFYRHPKTRRQYLKWAGLLLAAEEYHAGNMELGMAAMKTKSGTRLL